MYLAEGPPSHIWLQTLRVVREKSNFCICINDKKKKNESKKQPMKPDVKNYKHLG